MSLENPAATIVLQVAYDGTHYHGFAAQSPVQHVRTIEDELIGALSTFFRRDIDLTCAGRTDTGVHALAQHVSMHVTSQEVIDMNAGRLLRAMSALLPEDIKVTRVYRADANFSARFDALERTYRYRIYESRVPAVLARHISWWYPSESGLDVEKMQSAAQSLIGEHDFKSFCKASSSIDKTTMREVRSLTFCSEDVLGENMLAMDIAGNAFLHSMVRTIMGTLVEVGCGRREVEWVHDVLEARDRKVAGPCAPAKGLVLSKVLYPDAALRDW